VDTAQKRRALNRLSSPCACTRGIAAQERLWWAEAHLAFANVNPFNQKIVGRVQTRHLCMKQLSILAKMAGLNPPYGRHYSNEFSRINVSL
jgi:hypothetical protein